MILTTLSGRWSEERQTWALFSTSSSVSKPKSADILCSKISVNIGTFKRDIDPALLYANATSLAPLSTEIL